MVINKLMIAKLITYKFQMKIKFYKILIKLSIL